MTAPAVIREGRFLPRLRLYYLLGPAVPMLLSIVLIPFVPIYILVASFFVDRWIAAMKCTLTDRALIIRKGLFNRVESTIPLDKITDLQVFQGPVMRAMGLHGFRVETAGQSSGPGGFLVNMIGIEDTAGFRQAVLERRDQLAGLDDGPVRTAQAPGRAIAGEGELVSIARDIRGSLANIEELLKSRG